MADFNNTLTDRVTNEEAEAKIQEMKQMQNRHIWTIRHEYKEFCYKLKTGYKFQARLAKRYDYVTSSSCPNYNSRPCIFTVVDVYPHYFSCEAYDGVYRILAYVNINDYWIEGNGLVIIPTRWRDVC